MYMRRTEWILMLAVLLAVGTAPLSAVDQSTVSAKKQTTLGLYVTASEAYEMWLKRPKDVHIIDVRTPEEFMFVGHAPMSVNIPYMFLTADWYREKNRPLMTVNSDFTAWVKSRFARDDVLLLMCRSGGRSAGAVNELAREGFSRAYSIVDGFEGDFITDRESYYRGQRRTNGWKNSGAPWNQSFVPGIMAGFQQR